MWEDYEDEDSEPREGVAPPAVPQGKASNGMTLLGFMRALSELPEGEALPNGELTYDDLLVEHCHFTFWRGNLIFTHPACRPLVWLPERGGNGEWKALNSVGHVYDIKI